MLTFMSGGGYCSMMMFLFQWHHILTKTNPITRQIPFCLSLMTDCFCFISCNAWAVLESSMQTFNHFVADLSCHTWAVTLFSEVPTVAKDHPLPWLFYLLFNGSVYVWKISFLIAGEYLSLLSPQGSLPRQPTFSSQTAALRHWSQNKFCGETERSEWVKWTWPKR